MSDWSNLNLCAECGAANPHDIKLCVRCGVNLKQARAKSEAIRRENVARMRSEPMSGWSNLDLCAECGAANPRNFELCVRCGVDLKQARAKSEAIRQENIARMKESWRPIGSRDDKPFDELTVEDFQRHPVWEFDFDNEGEEGRDETWVRPAKELPVDDLGLAVIGVKVRLNNGIECWARLAGVDLENAQWTMEDVGLSVEKDGEWFHLARLFDSSYDEFGPAQLAEFLGLRLEEVFPITYDISHAAQGKRDVLVGTISPQLDGDASDES
jgi:ribosomal protein L40E